VIEVRDLSKHYGAFRAVDGVSLSVRRNELLGIIGPNGAGKTTLFNLVAGATKPTSGSVRFQGRDITRHAPHRRLRLGIARTFQLVMPFPTMTVEDNLVTAGLACKMSMRDARDRAGKIIELFDLRAFAERLALSLNSVEAKRLEVARALVSDPDVLLLDEIFSGLNPAETEAMVRFVRELSGGDLTILAIEHNIGVIRSLATRVVAMDAGSIVATGSQEDVFNDPRVIATYLGQRRSAVDDGPRALNGEGAE